MHRATIRNFEQALALLIVEVANQRNPARNTFDAVIAIDTVLGVHPLMQQPYLHILERQLFAIRIHAQGHRGAGPERH